MLCKGAAKPAEGARPFRSARRRRRHRLGHTDGVGVRGSVRSGTALIVAGAALAGGGAAGLSWPEARVAADVGSVLAAPVAAAPADAPPVSSAPAVPAPKGFVPQRLLVESLSIDAPLVTTVIDADDALVPPQDPAQLAWWRGVRPGEGAGSVLVAGHLDARRYGQGPLARIVRLDPGDRAVLTGPAGARATYVVRGVETFDKDALPAAELFSTGGSERLVLVTCGGTYDRDRRSWDSNVVAVLDPVRAG